MPSRQTELLLNEDCRIESGPDRMMLKADAVSAHARMKVDSEASSQCDLRSQFMAEAEAANARMKERMDSRSQTIGCAGGQQRQVDQIRRNASDATTTVW